MFYELRDSLIELKLSGNVSGRCVLNVSDILVLGLVLTLYWEFIMFIIAYAKKAVQSQAGLSITSHAYPLS